METLTQIEKAESERRERAWRYEQLTDSQFRLTGTIRHLESQVIDASPLEDIQRLAGSVPNTLTTRGGQFLAGGFIVREILASIASDALAFIQHKERARQTALAKARKDLAEVEVALAKF